MDTLLTPAVLSAIGGPAAGMLMLWYVIAKVMPKRDEVFATAIREVAKDCKESNAALVKAFEHHSTRIDLLHEAVTRVDARTEVLLPQRDGVPSAGAA